MVEKLNYTEMNWVEQEDLYEVSKEIDQAKGEQSESQLAVQNACVYTVIPLLRPLSLGMP